MAAAVWLIIADAAFFDVLASPFSEPAALVGSLLVAAGVLYLGQGWRVTVWGLVLAGGGSFLAILSKEQYLVLAAPVCLILVLAASPGPWRGLRQFRNRETAAAGAVAGVLVLFAAAYWIWDYTSSYGRRLHHIQAIDMIFTDIVTNRAKAPGQLRALGLPVAWARYAGHYYWEKTSIRQSPLYGRYVDKLTDGNIVHYLFTHPDRALPVHPPGQHPDRRPVGRRLRPAVPGHHAGRLPGVGRASQGHA